MFKILKEAGASFGNAFKDNVTKDVEHAKGEGAAEKADFVYRIIKHVIKTSWNGMVDRFINVILHSAMKDLRAMVRECRKHGLDPRDYMTESMMDRLPKNFA